MEDNELLIEVWSRLKPLIPSKDRLDAADRLVAIFDEHAMIANTDLVPVEFDKELKAAFANVYGISEKEEDDEWDQY